MEIKLKGRISSANVSEIEREILTMKKRLDA